MTELKPCPFCGAEAHVMQAVDGDFKIACTDICCALTLLSTVWCKTLEDAAEIWNERHERTCEWVVRYAEPESCRKEYWTSCEHNVPMADYVTPNYCIHCGGKVTLKEKA